MREKQFSAKKATTKIDHPLAKYDRLDFPDHIFDNLSFGLSVSVSVSS